MLKRVTDMARKGSHIQISLRGLVKYMTAKSHGQRKTLHDYKYPDPEGKAQTLYYGEARNAIADYHQKKKSPDWLKQQAETLEANAIAVSGNVRTRLHHNARALRAYERYFAGSEFTILGDLALDLTIAGVRVSVFPDLHVQEGKKERIIKLDFNVEPPDEDSVKIVTQAMYEAASKAGLGLSSSCVLYYDLSSGQIHKGARMGSRMRSDIEAACLNIEAIWETI